VTTKVIGALRNISSLTVLDISKIDLLEAIDDLSIVLSCNTIVLKRYIYFAENNLQTDGAVSIVGLAK